MKNNLAIKLTNLSKIYQVHHEKPTLVENIFKKNKKEFFTALKEINLEIKKGEKLGIIGSNGSGKTTLLKLIAGITTQTDGKIETLGKLVSLIDLSAGFHPELTGRENIFLNAMIVGLSKNEVKKKYNEIIDFADIGNFINAPLYTYSKGMELKLGFSIAIATDPDILILDEGIGFGDQNFQIKSSNKIEEFFKKKKTILLVSHWMGYLKDHCTRVIRLEKGNLIDNGHPNKVIDKYLSETKK